MIIKGKEYDDEFCTNVVLLYREFSSCKKVREMLNVPQYVVETILKIYGFEINQSKKKEQRRNKICKNCGKSYFDKTKRAEGSLCSKQCQNEFSVKIRRSNDSYKGKELSKEEREFLSVKNKEIWSTPELREIRLKSIKLISIEKYGVDHWTQSPLVKEKIIQTNIKKYGSHSPMHNKDVLFKVQKTRNERGLNKIFDGKNMHQWAEERGVSYSYFKQVVNEQGFEAARKLSINQTNIECLMSQILFNLKCEFIYNKFIPEDEEKLFRPDFIIPSKKLIIECDGLFWHSDRIRRDDSYHERKKLYFENLGYQSLFFRSNEIINKLKIVESIIENKLKQNKNIFFARKLSIKSENHTEFFNENHLMGSGQGRIYTLSNDDEQITAAIQVKWKDLNDKILDISRFCTKMGCSVVGGYSKLIQHVIKIENPKVITTFVDKRYGSGEYLASLGFIKKTYSLSFQWTNGIDVFHRLNFAGNLGYEKNLAKIWDCGQTKWEMVVK